MQEQTPAERFGEVVAYVEQARAMLAKGEWVELKDLDGDVRRICERIGALSPEQGREYLPELTFLQELVGELENEMRAYRDAVGSELKGAGDVKRANRAYAQGDKLKPGEKG